VKIWATISKLLILNGRKQRPTPLVEPPGPSKNGGPLATARFVRVPTISDDARHVAVLSQ